jgi:uncharacterized protein
MKLPTLVKILLLFFFSIIGFSLSIRFPDLDIAIFGIGMHRFFLFHSALIPILLIIIFKIIFTLDSTITLIVSGFLGSFTAGIGVHLFTDLFQAKAIMFPFIGSLIDGTSLDDRIWLIVNTLVCFCIAGMLYRKAFSLAGIGRSGKQVISTSTRKEKAVDEDLEKIKEKIRAEFVIYKDRADNYRFHLKAPNGEIILQSEGYTTKHACINGIEAVKKYSMTNIIEEVE